MDIRARVERWFVGHPNRPPRAPLLSPEASWELLIDYPSEFLATHVILSRLNPGMTGPCEAWWGPAEMGDFADAPIYQLHSEPCGFLVPPISVYVFFLHTNGERDVNFAALPAFPLPVDVNDLGIAVACTAPLTGCAIVMQREVENTGPFMTHIQPASGGAPERGRVMQTELTTACFNGSEAPVQVYGKQNYDNRTSSVIAIRQEAVWSVYAQEYTWLERDDPGPIAWERIAVLS